MAKRTFDFTDAEKTRIHELHDWTCAACGFDWADHMEADHWIAGDSQDDGVTLCSTCNRVKGKVYIPEILRLPPRDPLYESDRFIWQEQIESNRRAWREYVGRFRGALPKYINGRKWPHFKAPY